MKHQLEHVSDDLLVADGERELEVIELEETFEYVPQYPLLKQKMDPHTISGFFYDGERCVYTTAKYTTMQRYQDKCWNCSAEIKNSTDPQCLACGFHICSSCGRCKYPSYGFCNIKCNGLAPLKHEKYRIELAQKIKKAGTIGKKTFFSRRLKERELNYRHHIQVVECLIGEDRAHSELWQELEDAQKLHLEHFKLFQSLKEPKNARLERLIRQGRA